MIPLKSTTSFCISSPDFYALMGTAVVITAAATFWCTRQFSRRCNNTLRTAVTTPTTVTAKPSSTPTPAASTATDELSYLCTSCGTEKYSAEQLDSTVAASQTKTPYKMVILVRTDLNMV